jgi:fibronectin-binding autotransporter adhesin
MSFSLRTFPVPATIFVILFVLQSQILSAQTNLYSGGTGTVTGITWYTSATRTGATATPGATSILNIGAGHSVTQPSNTTVTYAGIVVNDNGVGGTFTFGSANNASSLTVTGNIVVNNGGTIQSGGTGSNHNLFLQGHMTIDGTANFTSGNAAHYFNFTGSSDQTVSGTGSISFERVVMNTTGAVDVNVNSSFSVSTNVNFNADGKLILDANSNITMASAATFTGASATRYIQVDESTSVNGQLIKTTAAATTGTTSWRITYPIGTATGGYTPLDLSAATISAAPTANATLSIKILYNASISGVLRRQFRLIVTGNAVANTLNNARFYYNETTDVSTGDVLSSYTLLRYTNNAGVTGIIAGTAPGTGYFQNTAAQTLANGTSYFSIGSSAIWYTYEDGNWTDYEVWTQDPSGTTLVNTLNQIPLAGDQVVILNGFTITSNTNSITLSTLTIEGGGTLDLATTTGHNLGTVDGEGLLRINGTNLPTGTYTSFVSSSGGTIEYYNTSGTLSTTMTTYNNLIFSNSSNAAITFINASNLTVNGDLTISQTAGTGTVTWQINNATATQRTITLNNDLIVSANGRIRAGTGAPANAHTLNIYGDITNNGSIKFFDDTDANLSDTNYGSLATTTAAYRTNTVLVTFADVQDQTLTCNNQTDFYRLIVDKGSGQQAILTVYSSSTSNFRLFGPNNRNYTGAAPDYVSSNALSIVDGTLQLTGFINIPNLVQTAGPAISGGWPIPETGALWINSPNVTIQNATTSDTGDNGRQIYVFGLLRMTSGTLNMGYSRGILGGGAGVMIIEGGTINTYQLRTTYLGSNNRFAYKQSGGTVNVGTSGLTGPDVDQYPRFALPYAECTFEMTGGTLNVANPTASGTAAYNNGGILIFAATSNINVTGGTVNAILPASNTNFNVCSTAPFYRLNISKEGAAGSSTLTINSATFNDGTTYTRAAQPLVVKDDLTLLTGNTPAMNCNSFNLTVGGDFEIQASTTFTSGTNTITFDGTSAQAWTNNGTISSLANTTVVMNKTGTLTLQGSQNFPAMAGLTLTSGTLNDNGKALDVTTTLSNSATHTGTGVINTTTSVTTIGGSNGVFGNLSITTNGTITVSGTQTVTGNLRLLSTNSSLNIGANSLTVLGAIYSDATTGVAFSTTKRIITSGLRNDGGLTRQGSAGTLLFPVGTSTAAYSPVSINVTATTHGAITVRPVAIAHPNVTTVGQNLAYYWRVSSTGYSGVTAVTHSNYSYGSTGLLSGVLTTYKPALYDETTFTWSTGTTYNATGQTVVGGASGSSFSFGTTIDGEYTCGNITAGALTVFYSRTSGAWNVNTTWSNTPCSGPGNCGAAVTVGTFPCSTCPVVIGDANNAHTVTVDANGRTCGSLELTTGSTLDCSTFTGLNFGANTGDAVSGRGTMRINSTSFPAGDFSNFIGSSGGTVEWYGTTKTIPSTGSAPQNLSLTTYYNMTVSPNGGATITLPANNLTIYNDFTKSGTGTAVTNATATRNISIGNNFNIQAGVFNTASGAVNNFTVTGNTVVSTGATFQPTNTTTVTHTLTTSGSIVNNGTFTLRNTGHVVNLTFTGTTDASITGTNAGASTALSTLTLNKGTSQTPKLTIDVAGTLNLLTTGWLTLTNGNIVFDKSGQTFSLQTAAASYSIPSTVRLTAKAGTVNIIGDVNNNAGDLLLAGTLEVAGGDVNINPEANNRTVHNDIEYSTAGSPTIIVSDGNLYVNGCVRRPTTSLSGALVYNQSGGAVVVGGRNASAQNSRGVFEIENNTGSQFTMSGGTLSVYRSAGAASNFADIYLTPQSSTVSAAATINIGLATGTVTTPLSINIVPAIGSLTIVGNATAQSVEMRSSPLTTVGTLTIESNTTLNTNALDVTIGGDLSIVGTYNGTVSGGNTTTFNGSTPQDAVLSATSTFQNMTISNSGSTVSLSGTSPTINNLNILSGTLDVASIGLSVQGDVVNNSIQTGSGAIVMSGTSTTQDIISNGGVFTNLTIAGSGTSKDVKLTGSATINGTLTFSSDYRYFSVGSDLLTFGTAATISGAGSLRYVRTNGATSDLGVVKEFAAGNNSFTFEIGVLGYYTPIAFTLDVTSPGSLTVAPVNQRHPTTYTGSAERILNYYWVITRGSGLSYNASGSHVYSFPSGLITGSGGTLSAGFLDVANLEVDPNGGWVTSAHGGSATTSSMTFNNLLGTNLPSAGNFFHYTVGTPGNTGTLPSPIQPIYSRLSNASVADLGTGGSWSDVNSWTFSSTGYGAAISTSGVPYGIPVVILPNSRINVNETSKSSLFTKVNGLLVLGTTNKHNLGIISGTGTLRISTNTFPAGTYTSFVSASGGTIEYYTDGSLGISALTMNNRTTYNNLSFTGTWNVSMTNSDITLNGSMNIGAGTTLVNTNNRNITVARNWTNAGAFTPGTGTVTFSGTTAQNINGTTTFYNLVVNKGSNNLTLAGTGGTSVSNTLTLSNGHVISSSTNKIVLGSSSSISGGSSSSFISGPAQRISNAGSTFIFPLGSVSGSRYRPMTLANTSASDTWDVEYVGSNPSLSGYDNQSMNISNVRTVSEFEFWLISRAGTSSADVTLSYNTDSYYPPIVGDLPSLRVARWDGTWWDLPPGGGTHSYVGNTTAGTVTVTGVTSFSPFTLASTLIFQPLPVTWLKLSAEWLGPDVIVQWTTAQETDNANFEIQRSSDGRTFTTVGSVAGSGTVTTESHYRFEDKAPGYYKHYYRIKQIDFSGKFDYSNIIMLSAGEVAPEKWSAYPNPYHAEVLQLARTGGEYTTDIRVDIYSAQGRQESLISGSVDEVNVQLAKLSSTLTPGTYLFRISSGARTQTIKVVRR